jgi:beta-mannanase
MLSVSPNGTGLTPRSIAQGKGDRFLVELNRLIAERNVVTYVRPMSEMNNGNNSYSAYRLNGSSRGAAYTTTQFKKAWRRMALILRGGDVAAIDAKLRRLKLPKVSVAAQTLPTPPVAIAWVPLSFGNPEIAKNHPSHWWPGSAYVDWVGTTWYSPFRAAKAMHRFYGYRTWRRKPFMFAEWGVWGREDPGFVRTFFGFLKSHPRVRAAVYYQSANLKPAFRLSAHPRSRAALRKAVKWPRLLGRAPEF